jgi:hypothetical protein
LFLKLSIAAKHISELEQHAMRAHNFFTLEHELFIQAKKVTPRTEQELYAALGLDWVEPSARRSIAGNNPVILA